MGYLIAIIAVLAIVLAWALMEISMLNRTAKMADEFRENDRRFYREWEDAWFAQLMGRSTVKPTAKPVRKARKKS